MTKTFPFVVAALVVLTGCGFVVSQDSTGLSAAPVSLFPVDQDEAAATCAALATTSVDPTLSEAKRAAATQRRSILGC